MPLVKFEAWKLTLMITMIARIGTAAFQITTAELLSDSSLAPYKLITVNTSIAALAMSRPRPFSVLSVFTMVKCFCAQSVLFR